MENKPNAFSFKGRPIEYFGLWLINTILRGLTFGLYYPWAKTNLRKFMYSNTEFEGTRFTYSGTGLELLIGFLKAIALILTTLLLLTGLFISKNPVLIVIEILFSVVLPFLFSALALHGSMRYLASRVSWRGIFFSYSGQLKSIVFIFLKYAFLILVGLGVFFSLTQKRFSGETELNIFAPSLLVFLIIIFYTTFYTESRGYLFNNIRWGKVEVFWYGDGSTFFMLRLRYLLPLMLLALVAYTSRDRFTFLDEQAIAGLAIFFGFWLLAFMVCMIWYYHGYLHFMISNFRLFQGDTECEVWHTSKFKDTLLTWAKAFGILVGTIVVTVGINLLLQQAIDYLWLKFSSNVEVLNLDLIQYKVILAVISYLLVLGFMVPVLKILILKWIINGIRIEGNFDINALTQPEQHQTSAVGDDLADMFNIDII